MTTKQEGLIRGTALVRIGFMLLTANSSLVLIHAQTVEKITTASGQVHIRQLNDVAGLPPLFHTYELTLDGRRFLRTNSVSVDVAFKMPVINPTLLVLMLSNSSNHCPAHFRILDLTRSIPQISRNLGPCYGDKPRIDDEGGRIRLSVYSFDRSSWEDWVYIPTNSHRDGLLKPK